jgi:hypothetical protein
MRLMSEINIRALAGNIRAQTTGKKNAEGDAFDVGDKHSRTRR